MGTGMACAQSALPPTSPTILPTAAPVTAPLPITAPVRVGVPAKVKYADGKLEVTADNSSLNQILREIGRLTGMTISGGVTEQRVFGTYGPAAPAEVLGDLLQGTGSNMLLHESSSSAPPELILSPRVGDVTPPNPNAPGFDGDTPSDDADRPQPSDQPVHVLHSADPITRAAAAIRVPPAPASGNCSGPTRTGRYTRPLSGIVGGPPHARADLPAIAAAAGRTSRQNNQPQKTSCVGQPTIRVPNPPESEYSRNIFARQVSPSDKEELARSRSNPSGR